MITRSAETPQEAARVASVELAASGGPQDSSAPAWQRAMASAVSSIDELLDLLALDAQTLADAGVPVSDAARRDFPLRVPRGFVDRMRPGDPLDPLLLQVLPIVQETHDVPGFIADPLGELNLDENLSTGPGGSPPGLLHKYHGRVLLITSGACAVNCRYCFRRHFPYGDHRTDWQPTLDYIAANPTIREVILSGGDPLAMSDAKLAALVSRLEKIEHVDRLRIHTRLPIVVPERINEALEAWFTRSRLRPVMVIHANHPREINASVRLALSRLRASGVTLLNQSVVLARVNDDVETLRLLSEALFQAGVLPYYLHLLDPVAGAAHFHVPDVRARQLLEELRSTCSGYLVPTLVREVPGAPAKTPLGA